MRSFFRTIFLIYNRNPYLHYITFITQLTTDKEAAQPLPSNPIFLGVRKTHLESISFRLYIYLQNKYIMPQNPGHLNKEFLFVVSFFHSYPTRALRSTSLCHKHPSNHRQTCRCSNANLNMDAGKKKPHQITLALLNC